MTIKERMLKFLSYKQLSQGKFEKETGLSNGFINNIGEGITTTSLIKIITKYPELNATWLLTGYGEMLLTPSSVTKKENPAATGAAEKKIEKQLAVLIKENDLNKVKESLEILHSALKDAVDLKLVFGAPFQILPLGKKKGKDQGSRDQDRQKDNDLDTDNPNN